MDLGKTTGSNTSPAVATKALLSATKAAALTKLTAAKAALAATETTLATSKATLAAAKTTTAAAKALITAKASSTNVGTGWDRNHVEWATDCIRPNDVSRYVTTEWVADTTTT